MLSILQHVSAHHMCHHSPIVQWANRKQYENSNKDSLMMDMFKNLHVKNILSAYKVGSTKL
jgi:hypothetical protein